MDIIHMIVSCFGLAIIMAVLAGLTKNNLLGGLSGVPLFMLGIYIIRKVWFDNIPQQKP